MPAQIRNSPSSSIFATYIYNSLGRPTVAEEYRHIFSSGKVNIRKSNSGTLIFVPHSNLVTMTTHGMVCKDLKVENSQIFSYNNADRFVLLPHLLEILGLRDDDELLSTLVREMDDNPYLVADPITADVQARITQSLEECKRKFKVSELHDDARRIAGEEHFHGLVREAVSLLVRLGATVPETYVNRASFYDVTRQLQEYKNVSSHIGLLFDRGVTLDGLTCEICLNGEIAIFATRHRGAGFVIAHIKTEQLSQRPPPTHGELDDEAVVAQNAGLASRRLIYDVRGNLRLIVTQSNPGRGLLSLFNRCYAN